MPGLVVKIAAFYNNASVSPSVEQLSKDKVIYAVSVPEQVSVAWCNYVLFLSPFLASWWMVWKAVVVITEKLHPETGTSALSNSQELRSRDQFLFGVGKECWCERWSSWVSEENAMVTRTFIIVSATVGIVTIAMVIRKSFHALCTGRRQQVTAAPINAPLSALPADGLMVLAYATCCLESQEKQKSLFFESWSQGYYQSLGEAAKISQTFDNLWLLHLFLASQLAWGNK